MPCCLTLPEIPEAERSPLVETLLGMLEQLLVENQRQLESIQQLRDEISELKGEQGKPKIKPSGMEENAGQETSEEKKGKPRPGSAKRMKVLSIDEVCIVKPSETLPEGSVFRGYEEVMVQDIRFESWNTCYRCEVWISLDGRRIRGELPAYQQGQRFGATLRQFVLYQHHHCQVTQPLLHEQLREVGVDISRGQIDALLSKRSELFIEEKAEILRMGLAHSEYIHVDDSGARHQGRNGYVTHIGNEAFACFSTSFSKSRINFLEILHGGEPCYVSNASAQDYYAMQGLPKAQQEQLFRACELITGTASWGQHLKALGIDDERHQRIATEGALLGGLVETDFNPQLIIVSDGAGQFAILLHALCWVHAERLIHKLVPLNNKHREEIAEVRSQIWDLYADLKLFYSIPTPSFAAELEGRFEAIFSQQTSYETLNQLLKRLLKRKQELLLVLQHPQIPLHNNLSEGDIREYVKKRKISGGTRSERGRQCRDAFASLKKTCRKQGLSFWLYLGDRIRYKQEVPPLAQLVRERLRLNSSSP